MKCIVLTQSKVELDEATETFLLSALDGLERECDSVQSCRVLLQGADSSPGARKPFCVTLLLSTPEYDISIKAIDSTHNALTARDTIRSAIGEAEDELRRLKLTGSCATCCDRPRPAAVPPAHEPPIPTPSISG